MFFFAIISNKERKLLVSIRFPYTKQSIDQTDLDAVQSAMEKPLITRGEIVEEFESQLCKYCGANYAVVFNSGSSALSASYFAINLESCDQVYTTPITFIASLLPVFQKKAKVTYCDIESNGNLSLKSAIKALKIRKSKGRKIFVPMHYGGNPIGLNQFSINVKDPSIVVVEDGAHALGACYPSGERVGSCRYSDLTIFSFHPAKSITTGEGGAALTNDKDLADRLRLYRNNGIISVGLWNYDVKALTGNFHMTEFQAALGINQLSKLDQFIDKRRELAGYYQNKKIEGLSFLDVDLTRSSCHLNVVSVDSMVDKFALQNALLEKGIGTQVHYKPLYMYSICKSKGLSTANTFYEKVLSLPLYPDLNKGDIDWICDKVNMTISQQLQSTI